MEFGRLNWRGGGGDLLMGTNIDIWSKMENGKICKNVQGELKVPKMAKNYWFVSLHKKEHFSVLKWTLAHFKML